MKATSVNESSFLNKAARWNAIPITDADIAYSGTLPLQDRDLHWLHGWSSHHRSIPRSSSGIPFSTALLLRLRFALMVCLKSLY